MECLELCRRTVGVLDYRELSDIISLSRPTLTVTWTVNASFSLCFPVLFSLQHCWRQNRRPEAVTCSLSLGINQFRVINLEIYQKIRKPTRAIDINSLPSCCFRANSQLGCCLLDTTATKARDYKKEILLCGQVFSKWLSDLVGVLCLDVAKRKIMNPSRGSRATRNSD